jgi:osmotically-inducible protein OsmY
MFKSRTIVKFLVGVGVIASFLGCQKPKNETVGQKLDDSVTTTKVKAAILAEPTLKTLQIDVITTKGAVRLSGAVDSATSVTKAGELAGAIQGVSEVKNDLVVK